MRTRPPEGARRAGRCAGGAPLGRVIRVCLPLACVLLAGCGGSAARTARLAVPTSTIPSRRARARSASDPASARARAGIPPALLAQARPIGAGARFRPLAPAHVSGRCSHTLGPRSLVHVEVFAANRVVIVPAGIGVGRPWRLNSGRIVNARCYSALVTLEPTGVVLVAREGTPDLGDLFRAWGQPLSRWRVASFAAARGTQVAVFLDGRRVAGAPGRVPLTPRAEVVVEVGPYVPPHSTFRFAPGPR